VTRSPKILIPAVLAVVAVAAFYMMVLSPKRDEAARLDKDIAAKQSQLEQSRIQAASYEKARANYKTNYTTLTRLGKAVTADDDVRSLLVQLDDAARRSKVDFHMINVGAAAGQPAEAGASSEPARPPGAVPVGSAGFSAMPFSFGFEGGFFRLSDFFNRLEDFVTVTNKDVDVTGRLLLVGSISVTPKADLKHMTAQIGAAAYLVPPAQGIEGATLDSPTGGEQGAAPPDGAGVTPTTSATITGVR
jgi:outer membrane murein-binding lipoprotein Lpp